MTEAQTEAETTEVTETSSPGQLFDSIADAVPAKAEDDWLAENDPEGEAPVEETPTAEHSEEQPETATPEESSPEPTPEEQAAYETSLASLRLAKWTTDDIESLSREQVVQFGTHVKARETEMGKTLEERAARITELESKATTETELPSGEPTVDLDLAEILKPLRDEHGEDLTGPLEKALKGVLQQSEARATKAEAATQAAVEAVSQRNGLVEHTIYELTRHQLTERFPEFKDPDKWAKVRARAIKFDGADYMPESGDVFAAATGMVRDAAMLEGLTDAQETARRESDAKVEQTRTNGTLSTTTEQTSPKAMSEDDKDIWILGEIEKGRPWQEVAQEAGTLR